MIRRVRTTAHAETDIRSIAQWIARDNVHAAVKWVDDLTGEFSKIAQTPGIGTNRQDLRPKLRSIAFGNYIIFFKSMNKGVIIVRVIHGARDYARILTRK
jgi:toxin ParE1/3/4